MSQLGKCRIFVVAVETAYTESHFAVPQIEHRWGNRVHLVDDPLALTLLGRLGARDTHQPQVGRLVRKLYEVLAWYVIAERFPRTRVEIPTRMITTSPQAVYRGVSIDPDQKAVTVAVARAGNVPSQVLYEQLNEVLNPSGVRQDHLVMSRTTDEAGQVTGTAFHTAKMGTDVQDRIVLFPDPMGATGSSMSDAVHHYKTKLQGIAHGYVAMHLVVTPEYLRRMAQDHPDVTIYALRFDRGLSSEQHMKQLPGSHDDERGLDEHQYIVPGAGGLGEVLNNAWV